MRARVGLTLLSLLASVTLGCFEAGPANDEASESESETGGPLCGNAIVEAGEACDDGNQDDTDACLASCVAASCGDGFVQANVEACDDGNATAGDGCSSSCTLESCGDGVVQDGEACDDGNQDDTDACTSLCAEASCGDGNVQAGVEACDDANRDDDDACTSACVEASCGDGFVHMGVEPCDDGNRDDTDGCLSGCVIASCGDGFVQAGVEECDDGNAVAGDGCTPQCMNECGDDCWGADGCLTDAGRCVRFSCRADDAGPSFCDACFGWQEITYDQWLNQGYCADVSARYRADFAYATACGDAPSCCTDMASCMGGDNAWHFSDGASTYYVGPCLGCMQADNCTQWNDVIDMPSGYTRISACERVQ
jgi:cysteine-rich repeat protein